MPSGLALLDWPPTPNFLAFSFCQAPPSTAYTCASTCIQMIFSCLFEKGRKYKGIYGDFLFQELCVLTLPINTYGLGHRKIKTIRSIIYGSIRNPFVLCKRRKKRNRAVLGNNYMCRRKINDGLGQSKFRSNCLPLACNEERPITGPF